MSAMTRDEWIAKARELLILIQGNPETDKLLAVSFAAPLVVEPEIVEAEFVEPPAAPQAEPAREAPVLITVPGARASKAVARVKPKPAPGRLERLGRFAARHVTRPDESEAPAYGTERVELAAAQLSEKMVDRGMDALEGLKGKAPVLRDRGAAMRGRRLGFK